MDGTPSEEYCINTSGQFEWWGKCCVWKNLPTVKNSTFKCVPKYMAMHESALQDLAQYLNARMTDDRWKTLLTELYNMEYE